MPSVLAFPGYSLQLPAFRVELPFPWPFPLPSPFPAGPVGQLCLIAGLVVALLLAIRALLAENVPLIEVPLGELEACDDVAVPAGNPPGPPPRDRILNYDPATFQSLGESKVYTPDEVRDVCRRAKAAQAAWSTSTFARRRALLRVLQKYILAHQRDICRVAARDSGKPLVDAAFGEVMVTCEKIAWLLAEGEKWLKPERRSAGAMMFYKAARVEWVPVGVMAAIVPWNYPFHNVFNPLVANLMAGNALVIKVSEHASWSSAYYGRIIAAALAAVGAPPDLVHIVTGYGDTGHALVTSPDVSKVVFVGSVAVGKRVAAAAAGNCTPVVLELGGKDPVLVLEDADLSQALPTSLRGAFQSAGQNCAGAERFYVHDTLYDAFVAGFVARASAMRQGHALGTAMVDLGAMCMPGEPQRIQALVDDAVAQGARLLCGGVLPTEAARSAGQFYPPTVLADCHHGMRLMREEVFGPVAPIVRVRSDDEAVALANDCSFGLGSAVFSSSPRRALAVAARLRCGMTSINDFATTYMCQALPFGGIGDSGYDRFAGVEGLRGCCTPKAVAWDVAPWAMRTDIPAPLRYPVAEIAFPFVEAIIKLFYGLDLVTRARALVTMAACFVAPASVVPRRTGPGAAGAKAKRS